MSKVSFSLEGGGGGELDSISDFHLGEGGVVNASQPFLTFSF